MYGAWVVIRASSDGSVGAINMLGLCYCASCRDGRVALQESRHGQHDICFERVEEQSKVKCMES